jgi:hypothetical protein
MRPLALSALGDLLVIHVLSAILVLVGLLTPLLTASRYFFVFGQSQPLVRRFLGFAIDFCSFLCYFIGGDIDFLSVSLIWFGALETVKSVCGVSYF